MKTQIAVWLKDAETESIKLYSREIVRNKKPRAYMTSWDFERLLNYIKYELYWMDISEDAVVTIEIFNEEEHWTNSIRRENI